MRLSSERGLSMEEMKEFHQVLGEAIDHQKERVALP